MRFGNAWLVILLVAAFAGTGFAAKKTKGKKEKVLRGVVVSVDSTNLKIKPNKGDAQEQPADLVVATDSQTVIKIDKKVAKVADIKPGMRVVIAPLTGVAKKVDIKTATATETEQKTQKKDGEKKPKKEKTPADKA